MSSPVTAETITAKHLRRLWLDALDDGDRDFMHTVQLARDIGANRHDALVRCAEAWNARYGGNQ